MCTACVCVCDSVLFTLCLEEAHIFSIFRTTLPVSTRIHVYK